MGNPVQSIPNLPPAISVDGTEQFWINQAGVDRRATLLMAATLASPGGLGVLTIGTTVGAMLQSIPPNISVFVTAGYYVVGDGGGGMYVRALAPGPGPGLIETADGGWWVLADTAPNLRQFGAKGDSVTDDQPALQAAMYFTAASGLPLLVPAGRYVLATRGGTGPTGGQITLCLIPTECDIRIIGEGYDSVFTIPDGFSNNPLGPAGDYIFFQSADLLPHGNVEVSGIHIDGNGGANLVLDSGVNVRRGYGFLLHSGARAYFHDCYFTSFAGRNVLILSSNTPVTPGWTSTWVKDCYFQDMGGAILGNEKQNDHSTIYVEPVYAITEGNVFINTNPAFNPQAAPARSQTAIENHAIYALTTNNFVQNYSSAGNAVAANGDCVSHVISHNQFLGMKGNIFQPDAIWGKVIHRLEFFENVFEIDNRNSQGGGGFFQSQDPGQTPIRYITFRNNLLYCLSHVPAPTFAYGIFICAADYVDIQENLFEWWQATGVGLVNQTGVTITGATWANTAGGQATFAVATDLTGAIAPPALVAGNTVTVTNVLSAPVGVYNGAFTVVSVPDAGHVVVSYPGAASPGAYTSGGLLALPTAPGINGGLIDRNKFRNCGIQSSLSVVFAIYILQPDTNKVFQNIVIGPDNYVVADPQPVGSPAFNCRGYRVQGPGNLKNIRVHTPRTAGTILRGLRLQFNSPTNNAMVYQVPRQIVLASAAAPTNGYLDIQGETIIHSDPSANGAFGRVVSVGGSGSEATWAAATAYTVGQWIKTSINKVLICMVPGVSGAVEPNPATQGQQYTDGTSIPPLTWLYTDAAVPVLNAYGSPLSSTANKGSKAFVWPALAAGAVQSTTVGIVGAAIGDMVEVSLGTPLLGTILSGEVTAVNTVTVYQRNPTGASVGPLASATLTAWAQHP